MKGKSTNYDDKKIKKCDFCKKKKKKKKKLNINFIVFNKILYLKKNHSTKVIRLYTLLAIMIMMLLGHYV